MKNNIFLQIIFIFLLGFIFAYYIYGKYRSNIVIEEITPVYFLQEGVYVSDNVIPKLKCPSITVKENQKFYTYIGMTLNIELAKKIKTIYEKEGINVYIKEVNISNNIFVSELSQYDILLKLSSNYKEINNILDTILSTYQECLEL